MSTPTIPAGALAMMTLAGLAATSGRACDSVSAQEPTIQSVINNQLANAALATAGAWQVVWVGLSDDLANLAYLAQSTAASTPTYAVVIRGTVFSLPMDITEDIDVTSVTGFWSYIGQSAPWDGCIDTSAVCISQGAMDAFTEITGATFTDGTTLVQTLTALAGAAAPTPLTLYVCGHSLGGAARTSLSGERRQRTLVL